MLGYYLKRQDQTIRPGGGFVGYEDSLMTLLEERGRGPTCAYRE